jgi:PAS domain S-box-containing protein
MNLDHQAEQAQRERLERIRAIFSRAGAVGITQTDLEGRCLLVNDRYCEMLGRSREHIAGRNLLDFTHQQDQARNRDLLQSITTTGDAFTIDKRYVRPDGALTWVNESVSVTRDRRGQPHDLFAVVLDITHRKSAEDALRESQSYLRLILNSAADAFYCIDREGNTTLCNLAFLKTLGFETEAEVVGRKLHGIIHHSYPNGSHYHYQDCPIYHCARTGVAQQVDHELFYRKDGSSLPVEYSVRPIIRDGVHQGAICTFRDITEQRKAEERQDLLVRELNHRVKNLFAVMGGIVSLSAKFAATPQDLTKVIRGRLDALARAHELVLPKFLRSRGIQKPVTSIDALLTSVLSPYSAEDGGIERIAHSGPKIKLGDKAATSLALVIHELATNAAKYGALSNEAGRVEVRWTSEASQLRLTWVEREGPVVPTTPSAPGFGSVLAERSVKGHLHGEIIREWFGTGLKVTLAVPLEHLAE